MEEFFRALRDTWGERAHPGYGPLFLLLAIVLLALAWQLIASIRRRQARRLEADRLARDKGIGNDDLSWLHQLCSQSGHDALDVLTRIAVFESASADALMPPSEEVAARVGRIRHSLGFDRLPAHFPVLTSRQMQVGATIDIAGVRGEVADVNELFFAVRSAKNLDRSSGAQLPLTLIHGSEARYRLTCTLLGKEDRLTRFGHDEAPERIQQREHVRVEIAGAVHVEPFSSPQHGGAAPEPCEGSMVNVSSGGMLAETEAELPAGLSLRLSFEVSGARFQEVTAIVIECMKRPASFAVRIEFVNLSEHERERLSAQLTRLTSHAKQAN